MNSNGPRNIVLTSSLILAALIIIASCVGIFVPGMYARETANWQAQSLGQDMVDLLLVTPVLIITSLQAYQKNKKGILLQGGVLLYIIYTFVIYCFDVHFNQLFIIYCFILGLSVYLFLWFILSMHKEPANDWFDELLPSRIIGIYMIVVAAVFYLLWLLQIIPANIKNTVPKELSDAGLFTNPVQVLDLSVCLPAVMITGVLLLRKHHLGFLLTPVVLLFFVLMDLTIASLIVVIKLRGLKAELLITIVMTVLALISWVLLTIYLRSMKK